MKRLLLFRFTVLLGLLYASLGSVNAQYYSSVQPVPRTDWDFTLTDINNVPVTNPLPNSRYNLNFRLNPGVTIAGGAFGAYIVTLGDGWYISSNPQTFPTGADATSFDATRPGSIPITTVGAADFSGVYVKAVLSNDGGISAPSVISLEAKAKLFVP